MKRVRNSIRSANISVIEKVMILGMLSCEAAYRNVVLHKFNKDTAYTFTVGADQSPSKSMIESGIY